MGLPLTLTLKILVSSVFPLPGILLPISVLPIHPSDHFAKNLFPPGKLAWFDSLGQGYSKGSPQSSASPQIVHKEISAEMEKSEFKKLQYFDITMASKYMIINLFEPS